MAPNLAAIKAIIFDVYGTLVDWESPIYEGLIPIIKKNPACASWSRKDVLEAYCIAEAALEEQHPDWLYAKVLEESYRELDRQMSAAGEGTSGSEGDAIKFAESIRDWPPFSDTVVALRSLAKRYKLTVLSNVDHQSTPLNPSLAFHPRRNPESKSPFTLVLTAQDTGAYKPSPLGIGAAIECIINDPDCDVKDKSEILVVAVSLFHDVYPAHELGLKSVWIHRQGTRMGLNVEDNSPDLDLERVERLGEGKWSLRFETLGEFAEEVEKGFADSR
ncbi:HAD-like protein [Pleurotus eryngii]|uniref:HAD-like protein n=1 Tax=Pleurotus eryngii TaxID=5323 RepID=A0A9P5ZV64_PLEER|nr:HAD-like protein [Pleurotus eryngii]